MLRTLVNLRALIELAQLDVNLSVRSALRILTVIATVSLGFTVALAISVHNLRAPSFVFVGSAPIDRVVLILSVLWACAGVVMYGAAKRWIIDGAGNASRKEELSLRALLGADVMRSAFVDRLAVAFFSALLLAILSVGALPFSSLEDLGILMIGGGIGLSLYCQGAIAVIEYVKQPKRMIQHFSFLRTITPLSFAVVIATIIGGWQGIGGDVHISRVFALMLAIMVMVVCVVMLVRCVHTIRDAYGLPLGIVVDTVSQPRHFFGKEVVSSRVHTAVRLFVWKPLLAGLMATRWTMALTLLFFTLNASSIHSVNISDLSQNMIWFVAFMLVTTFQSVRIVPDLLYDGPLLRFYYEEKGSFLAIFASAFLARCLTIAPQTVVMVTLWYLVGGTEMYTIVLAALVLVSDLLARGITGSSYRTASGHMIMIANLVSFVIAGIGTLFLQISLSATVLFIISALFVASIAWRRNVTHAN